MSLVDMLGLFGSGVAETGAMFEVNGIMTVGRDPVESLFPLLSILTWNTFLVGSVG